MNRKIFLLVLLRNMVLGLLLVLRFLDYLPI